jgi:preprotein translocase subunit SecA
MDALKDAVSLRGYGQRDPLQEYKKEAFNLFQSLVVRIEDEITLTLLRMPRPNIVMDHRPETDEADLNYIHAEAEPAEVSQTEDLGDDGMIYHGSRMERERAAPVGTLRNTEKVGRNDPCPCGSKKKFKQCHGKLS